LSISQFALCIIKIEHMLAPLARLKCWAHYLHPRSYACTIIFRITYFF